MTLTIGLTQIIYAVAALLYIVAFFVGAAYGKRIGMRGGTVKDNVSAKIAAARKAANENLQAQIKQIKAERHEQI